MSLFHQILFFSYWALGNYVFQLTLLFFRAMRLIAGQWGMGGSDVNHFQVWILTIYHEVLHPLFPFFNNLEGYMLRLYHKTMKIQTSWFSEGGESSLTYIWIHFGCAKPLSFGDWVSITIQSILSLYSILFNYCFTLPSPSKTFRRCGNQSSVMPVVCIS